MEPQSPNEEQENEQLIKHHVCIKPEIPKGFDALTRRQVEILQGLMSGEKAKAIAVRLGMDQRTVATHRQNIMHRLKVDNFVELVRVCIGKGL